MRISFKRNDGQGKNDVVDADTGEKIGTLIPSRSGRHSYGSTDNLERVTLSMVCDRSQDLTDSIPTLQAPQSQPASMTDEEVKARRVLVSRTSSKMVQLNGILMEAASAGILPRLIEVAKDEKGVPRITIDWFAPGE